MQNKNKKFIYLKMSMIAVNFIAALFITLLIYVTTRIICDHFIAREFINSVSSIPWDPYKNIIVSITLFCVLILSFVFREFIYSNNNKAIYITLIIDLIVSITLIYFLNFNYNGILLLVIANIIAYTKGIRGRYVLMLLSVAAIIIADYQLISVNFNLYSVYDYIGYYDSSTQQALMVCYNSIVSINLVLFIIYCISVIQNQRGTIDEVNTLYEKLSKANEDLRIANEQLKEYSKITEKMGETRERNRLAREIHDTLGHTLTGILAGLDACLTTIEMSPQETKKQLEMIAEVTRRGVNEVRRSVNKLRPDALERLNLESAIQKMIMDVETMSNTKVTFETRVVNLKFDADEEDTIYRVIQESLTNAIRHGKASHVWITIDSVDGEIILTIRDNGIGCVNMKKGFGTRHIVERIQMLRGSVKFDGSDGFTVTARIPIRWGEEYD